jgi:hypothetical protein
MHRALYLMHRSAGVWLAFLSLLFIKISLLIRDTVCIGHLAGQTIQRVYYPEDGGTSSSETPVTHSDYPECGTSMLVHNVTNYQSSRRHIPEDNIQISTPSSISRRIIQSHKTHVTFPLDVLLVHEPKRNPFTLPRGYRRAEGPTDTSRISCKNKMHSCTGTEALYRPYGP